MFQTIITTKGEKMKRKFKGLSEAVTIALLVIIAIAFTLGIYFAMQRFTGGADVVQAQAMMVQNTYAGNSQVAVTDIRITSKTSTTLYVVGVVARVTYASGAVTPVTFGAVSATSPMALPASVASPLTGTIDGVARVDAGRTVELTITFTSPVTNQVRSVVFTIYLSDPAGNIRSVVTNEVTFT